MVDDVTVEVVVCVVEEVGVTVNVVVGVVGEVV